MDRPDDKRPDDNRNVFWKLSIPFWALLIFSLVTISGLVVFVTHNQNTKAIETSIHLAKAVVAANQRDLGIKSVDNGYWDQAVENLVTEFDPDWADDNVGAYLFESAGVSSSYVLDGSNRPVYSAVAGERTADDPLKRFSGGLDVLIERARSGDPAAEPEPALGLVRDLDTVYFAAVVRLTTYFTENGVEVDRATDSLLMLTRKVDEDFLAALSDDYLFHQIHLLGPVEPAPVATLALAAADKSLAGTLAWRPQLPGDEILPVMLAGIAAIFLLMAATAFVFLGRARRIVAELGLARDGAEQANKAKSEFLANMSHELRTPLNAVMGFSEIIHKEIFGPVGHEKYLTSAADIHGAGEHLLELINEVLDLSKIEAGQTVLNEELVLLNEQVQSTVALVRNWASEKNVTLKIDLDDDLPSIVSDQTAMKQIILNLLTNALKFTPSGGEVSCSSTVAKDGGVMLKVADTGIGIDDADMARVLEPFGQVAAADSRDHEGTGLGLPITNKLTELLGGTFKLESEFGVGTQVTVSFPRG